MISPEDREYNEDYKQWGYWEADGYGGEHWIEEVSWLKSTLRDTLRKIRWKLKDLSVHNETEVRIGKTPDVHIRRYKRGVRIGPLDKGEK